MCVDVSEYLDDPLVGVAVFSVPARARVTTAYLHGEPLAHVDLGRFVLLDRVPANAESWFLARCRRFLALAGIEGFVSFADPEPRVTSGGWVLHGGHVVGTGTIGSYRYADYKFTDLDPHTVEFTSGPIPGYSKVFSTKSAQIYSCTP